MDLPLFDGTNYTLTRESPETVREFVEDHEGKVTAGWEMRVPGRGPDGVPYLMIFVGPTREYRGSAIRLRIVAKDGSELPAGADVRLETYHKSGGERSIIFQGTYGEFQAIPDQHAPNAALAAQKRAEAGEDYIIRLSVTGAAGGPEPDPAADDTFFEVECVKLWWNETA